MDQSSEEVEEFSALETSSLLSFNSAEEELAPKRAKSGFWPTVTSIVKSHCGLGSLLIPYGFIICGYQLALFTIALSALVTFTMSWLLV